MLSHILKFLEPSKTQKPKYFENEILFFLQKKTIIHDILRVIIWQKIVF